MAGLHDSLVRGFREVEVFEEPLYAKKNHGGRT